MKTLNELADIICSQEEAIIIGTEKFVDGPIMEKRKETIDMLISWLRGEKDAPLVNYDSRVFSNVVKYLGWYGLANEKELKTLENAVKKFEKYYYLRCAGCIK